MPAPQKTTPTTTPAAPAGANGAPPPNPEVDAKTKDRSDLAAAARREEQRVRKQRLEDQKRAEAEAARERELSELRAKAARADALEKKATEDALGFLEERGISSRDVGERIIKQGTPDARAQELQARLDKLEQEREAERKDREERLKREEAESNFRQARKVFDAAFDEVKKDSPILSSLGERKLLEEYKKTYDLAAADPELAPFLSTYTDQELLRATEERLRTERGGLLDELDEAELEAALTRRRAKAESKTEPGQQTGATGRQGEEAASSRNAKPLTQRDAQTTAGSWKPANWDKLPDREQTAILADRLRKGLPCD